MRVYTTGLTLNYHVNGLGFGGYLAKGRNKIKRVQIGDTVLPSIAHLYDIVPNDQRLQDLFNTRLDATVGSFGVELSIVDKDEQGVSHTTPLDSNFYIIKDKVIETQQDIIQRFLESIEFDLKRYDKSTTIISCNKILLHGRITSIITDGMNIDKLIIEITRITGDEETINTLVSRYNIEVTSVDNSVVGNHISYREYRDRLFQYNNLLNKGIVYTLLKLQKIATPHYKSKIKHIDQLLSRRNYNEITSYIRAVMEEAKHRFSKNPTLVNITAARAFRQIMISFLTEYGEIRNLDAHLLFSYRSSSLMTYENFYKLFKFDEDIITIIDEYYNNTDLDEYYDLYELELYILRDIAPFPQIKD